MSKALLKASTTTIHKGGKRTHIHFREAELAHNEAKTADHTFFGEDASSCHSHGLKWLSSSSVEIPSSSNAVIAPSTTTQGDEDPAGPCEKEEDGGPKPKGKAKKRKGKDKKKQRNENKLETKDHVDENDGTRQVLRESAMVKDQDHGVIDQEEVQSAIEPQTVASVSAVIAPATKNYENEERDEDQSRGSSERLPSAKEKDMAIPAAGPSGRLSSLVILREIRLFVVRDLTLNQLGLGRQVGAEGESRTPDFPRSSQRLHKDLNFSVNGRHLLNLAYDDLTLQEGDEEVQDEGDLRVDGRVLDAPTSVVAGADSTIDSRSRKTKNQTSLTGNSTFKNQASQERQPKDYGSTSAREQVQRHPGHAENTNSPRGSSSSGENWDVKSIICLDDDGDQVAVGSSPVQNCETRHSLSVVEHRMKTAELGRDISPEKDCLEHLRTQQLEEQRRRDYVVNELIKRRQGQEEDMAEHACAPKRRTRGSTALHDRQASLENLEASLRNELLQHESSLAEQTRRF